MNPIVFYTFVSDSYYTPVGTPQLISSFKKFHPDIPLVVYRQDVVDKIIGDNKSVGVNWLNAKPFFGRLLKDQYECVVNIDADSVVLGRLEEVLTKDYDIGSVMNLNDYENVSVENVTEEMFLQAGLVASRRAEFWERWINWADKCWQYRCAENDTLNLLVYNELIPEGWKLKIFDKDKDYYGCKVLGREKECEVKAGKVMCRGEQVKIYHAAKGPGNLPKLAPDKLKGYGFKDQVIEFINMVGNYGTTEIYA